MADNNIPAYPYMFDSSQLANPYSQFKNKALPWPSQYSGVPTDARGQPIQSYLDAMKAQPTPAMAPPVSLNSNPNQWAMNNALIGGMQATPRGNVDGGGRGVYQGMDPSAIIKARTMNDAMYGPDNVRSAYANAPWSQPMYGNMANGPPGGQGAAGAGPPGGSPAPQDMSAAYLNALSNPGHVTTPGATVAQAPTPTGQSNVLQQFLANWQNRGSPTQGAGNYSNAGFFNALQGGM